MQNSREQYADLAKHSKTAGECLKPVAHCEINWNETKLSTVGASFQPTVDSFH